MKFFRFLFFSIYLSFVICHLSLPAYAGDPQKQVLDNGLTVIVKELPGTKLTTAALFIKTGEINEDRSNAGISGLVGSMLMSGTKSLSAEAISEELEQIGAEIGVAPSSDFCQISVLSKSDDFKICLKILGDILNNSAFPKDELAKKKKLALAAINQLKDEPGPTVYDELLSTLYGKHPYGIKEEDKIKSISNLTRNDLIAYYNNYYIPKNIVIAIAGDINIGQAVDGCKNFLKFDRADGIVKTAASPKKLLLNRQKTLKNKQIKAAWIELGYLTCPLNHTDTIALRALNSVLGGGMSSRLFVNIREKEGLAYSVGSYYPSLAADSHFVLYAVTGPKNAVKVKSKLLNEVNKIKTAEITAGELEHHKNALKGKFIISHQKIDQIAWHLGWFETMGMGFEMDREYPNRIDQVTAKEIREAANRHLKTYGMVTLTP